MNGLRMKAAVTGSLLGTLFAGIAVAGESAAPKVDAQAQRDALVSAFFERMDANKDAQVTRLEAELSSKSLFAKLDGNGDGEVTQGESQAGARALRKAELSAHLVKADVNRDGQLTAEEAQLPPALFERLDTDKSRGVSLAELEAMPVMGGDRQQAEFNRADSNHDGKVTREESSRSAKERFDTIDANKDNAITRPEVEARAEMMMKAGAKTAARAASPK